MSKMNGKWINKDTDNLTHSGDDLAVKFSDADAPDNNKVWSSEKINTVSGALASQIPTDFYSQAEITTISGDIVSQIPSDFYSTTEVTTISGDIVSQIITDHGNLDGLGDDDHTQYLLRTDFTTSSGDIVAQMPTDFYTQAEVDTISGALNDKIGAAGAVDTIDYFTLDGDDIITKSVTLSQTPVVSYNVALDIVGGTTQYYGTDYTVSGTNLSWDSLGLDGVIEESDQMRAIYSY